MVDRILGPVAGHRMLFLLLAVILFFLRLLPLHNVSAPCSSVDLSHCLDLVWPGPDLLVCLVFAWVLRRPDYMPFWLIAGVIFAEDLLMMRPPGLWAALVLGGSEFLRSRIPLMRELNFGVEWMLVSAVMATIFVANRLIFTVTLLPKGSLDADLIHLIVTILVYPFVVGVSILAFGLRKPATGEVDATGRRI
jgi:rod shape-determining protein MreD